MAHAHTAAERRVAARFDVPGKAVFRTVGDVLGEGETLNVGRTGIRVRTHVTPTKGDAVLLYFRPYNHHFVAAGTIAWAGAGIVGIEFSREPEGLADFLEQLAPRNARGSRRVKIETKLRLRREDGSTVVVEPNDMSRSGFNFQSVNHYQVGEQLAVALHYQPEHGDDVPELPSLIVRKTELSPWDGYSYGVQVLIDSDKRS